MPLSLETKPYFYKAMQSVAEKDPAKVPAFKQHVAQLESTLDRITADGKVDLAEVTQDFAKLYSGSAELNGVQSVFFELIAKAVDEASPQAKTVLTNAHTAFSAASFKETAAVGAGFQLGNGPPATPVEALKIDAPVLGRRAGHEISAARLVGDVLELDIRYSAGFQKHEFQLSWDGLLTETLPPQAQLTFSHQDNGERGQALALRTLKFDLKELRQLYADGHNKPSGSIALSFGDSKVAIPRYNY